IEQKLSAIEWRQGKQIEQTDVCREHSDNIKQRRNALVIQSTLPGLTCHLSVSHGSEDLIRHLHLASTDLADDDGKCAFNDEPGFFECKLEGPQDRPHRIQPL